MPFISNILHTFNVYYIHTQLFTNPEIAGNKRYKPPEELVLWGDTFILSGSLQSVGGSKQFLRTLVIKTMNMLRAVTQEQSAVGKQRVRPMKAAMILSCLLLSCPLSGSKQILNRWVDFMVNSALVFTVK